jgi:glycosyltransferase involved in cell wall biosynthesis
VGAVRVAFHIDQLWFSAPGGIGTYVRELLSRLHDDRVELVPFSSKWSSAPSVGTPLETGTATAQINLPVRVLYPAWAAVRRPRLPRRFGDLDVVHATNHSAIPPTRADQALVTTVHDLAFERFPALFPDRWRRLYERGVKIAIDEAAAILVPSAFIRDELRDRGADGERVHVTPLGPSQMFEAEPGSIEDDELQGVLPRAPFVLAVGTVEPRKNLPRLVRAFRRAAPEASLPHHLLIAGPAGWHQEELLAELREDDDDGRVHVVGWLDGHDLDRVYREAAAAAYISLYEGFGIPVLDALAHGVPTLASNIGAITEVAGDAALLVDPLDEDAIAQGLVRILTDEAVRSELSAKGPARAARYSWDATAHATLAVYRQVAR